MMVIIFSSVFLISLHKTNLFFCNLRFHSSVYENECRRTRHVLPKHITRVYIPEDITLKFQFYQHKQGYGAALVASLCLDAGQFRVGELCVGEVIITRIFETSRPTQPTVKSCRCDVGIYFLEEQQTFKDVSEQNASFLRIDEFTFQIARHHIQTTKLN